MRRLLLLRHAKSSWADPGVRDHDRPLNDRGRTAAPLVGGYLRAHDLIPDRVLCSSARRTCETLALLDLPDSVDIEIEHVLYLAYAETVLDGRSGLLFPAENMLYLDDTTCRFRHIIPAPERYLRELANPSAGYVRGIAAALERLAADPDLYATLAHGALASVRDGHLSMAHRRDLLAGIYAAAAGDA